LNESKRAHPEITPVTGELTTTGSPADIFEYCARELKLYDPDRYFSALFAPPEQRRALVALYAFNLEIAKTRETVSETMLGHIRLQWWREALDGIYGGKPRQHAVVLALHDAVGRHDLSRDLMAEMIDGRERDLDEAPPSTLDEVVSYASATSGALVSLALEAAGHTGDGRKIGIAYALTGLIRAIPFQAGQGRSFLPGLQGNAIVPEAIGVREQVQSLVEVAEFHRERAIEDMRGLSRLARSVCLPLATCQADLSCIRGARFDPFTARYSGPLPRRFRMLKAHLTGRI
jgi:NADH dehydrogenase [ubiquinone] 1 alpha subcomplex assembly factor 6